jgi:hypothetical protein
MVVEAVSLTESAVYMIGVDCRHLLRNSSPKGIKLKFQHPF